MVYDSHSMFWAGFTFILGAIAAFLVLLLLILAAPLIFKIFGVVLLLAATVWISLKGVDVVYAILLQVFTNINEVISFLVTLSILAAIYFIGNLIEKSLKRTGWFQKLDAKVKGRGCLVTVLGLVFLYFIFIFILYLTL